MGEILLFMAVLYAAYRYMPASWLSKIVAMEQAEPITDASTKSVVPIPEDSVLKRHFITRLRCEIEAELFPRPTDATLKRHYDALVEAELESRLAALTG